MTEQTIKQLIDWAAKYNDPVYFAEDPIAFPREFMKRGASLQDIEIAAVFAAHFAWGRRAMIVRDLERFFDFLEWKPLDYVLSSDYRRDDVSVHRTIKWSETASICEALRQFYIGESRAGGQSEPSDGCPLPLNDMSTLGHVRGGTASAAQRWDEPGGRTGSVEMGLPSLEQLTTEQIRTQIFSQKEDAKAPNKKINMMRRWMVRNDGKVDLGLWKNSSPAELTIPLDVHVYDEAVSLGLTRRHQKDIVTAKEITNELSKVFPGDPCLGDFALFGYGVTKTKEDA